jgi:hypothetical protein
MAPIHFFFENQLKHHTSSIYHTHFSMVPSWLRVVDLLLVDKTVQPITCGTYLFDIKKKEDIQPSLRLYPIFNSR